MSDNEGPITRTGESLHQGFDEAVDRLKAERAARKQSLEATLAAKRQVIEAEEAAKPAEPVTPPPVVPVEPEPEPEEPKPEEPKVVLSPSLELEAGRLAAAEAARREAEEREAEEEDELDEPDAPPPAKKGLSSSAKGWLIIGPILVGFIVWVIIRPPHQTTTTASTTSATNVQAPAVPRAVPSPVVPLPPSVVLPTIPVVATPPAFTGVPGSIVCRSARLIAPTTCDTAGLHLLRERPDWVQPAYLCNETAMHGSDLCDCLVCKRIPN